MSLLEQLTSDMKEAMKAKDKVTLGVVRMVKASVSNEQIKLGHDLTADEELAVLSREMKQRVEEMESYKDADRADLAEEIQGQIDVLKRYMPAQMSEEEVVAIVKETIAEVGAASKAYHGSPRQCLSSAAAGEKSRS